MKVQIIVDDQIVNTQLISIEALGQQPPQRELKRMALQAALRDNAITIGESLQASFRLFDVSGSQMEADEDF